MNRSCVLVLLILHLQRAAGPDITGASLVHLLVAFGAIYTAWLRTSREAIRAGGADPTGSGGTEATGWLPSVLTLLVVGIGVYLSYLMFW